MSLAVPGTTDSTVYFNCFMQLSTLVKGLQYPVAKIQSFVVMTVRMYPGKKSSLYKPITFLNTLCVVVSKYFPVAEINNYLYTTLLIHICTSFGRSGCYPE